MISHQHLQISKYASKMIPAKAAELMGQYGFTQDDQGDIEQDLTTAVINAAPAFDPKKGKRSTYDNRVINRRIATLIRYRKRECRDYRRTDASVNVSIDKESGADATPWETLAEDADRRLQHTPSRSDQIDLAIDVQAALDLLTPEDRELCILLITETKTSAANQLQISKPTLYRRCKAIRARFAERGLDQYLHPDADASNCDGVCD